MKTNTNRLTTPKPHVIGKLKGRILKSRTRQLENIWLSDLWFNQDHSEIKESQGIHCVFGYDLDMMMLEAESFTQILYHIGCCEIPSPELLIEDYFSRI